MKHAVADQQISILAESGWTTCGSVREGLTRLGLPVPTADYLRTAFKSSHWERASLATRALRGHFASAKFADQATFGLVLVPDPKKLDTRGPIAWSMRKGQLPNGTTDVIDHRLPPGKLAIRGKGDWTLVATITGSAGIFLGSYQEIVAMPAERFSVQGVDTRDLMIRQVWGARVLQSGAVLPDSNEREVWTFTLFPGEDLTAGEAASGTVLHGKVRFRLGRTDRRISSVRVCPAIAIG